MGGLRADAGPGHQPASIRTPTVAKRPGTLWLDAAAAYLLVGVTLFAVY